MPTFSGALGAPSDFPKDLYDYTYEVDGVRKFDYELEVSQIGTDLMGYLGLIKQNHLDSMQKYALIKAPIYDSVSHQNADHFAFELLELFINRN